MNDEVTTNISNGVLTIAFNRPHKRNSITYEMYNVIQEQLDLAEKDPHIHVVVFTGEGDIFSAGNDIRSFRDGLHLAYDEKPSFQFMNTLACFTKPIVGAVNGDAIGIGATMLLHCDLVYCADTARLKFPFVALGLVPEFASSLLVPQIVGQLKAFELFTLNDDVSSDQAMALNLVNAVMPSHELMPLVKVKAEKLASRSPAAVQATKKLMKQKINESVVKRIDEEALAFTERLGSPEVQDIFSAFLSNR